MASPLPIIRARVEITGTKLEGVLQRTRIAGDRERSKLFARIDQEAAAAVGGKKAPDERGVPDILQVPSGSVLGQLLTQGEGVDPDIEWKSVTAAKAPEILSSVASRSIPTFQQLVRSGKITIAELSNDIAGSIIEGEKKLQREQHVLTRVRGAKQLEKQQGKVNVAAQRLDYKKAITQDLENAIINKPAEVLGLLGAARLRQIVDADAALMNDIRRKVNNIAFAVIKDPQKKRKVDGLFFFAGLGRHITINDLEIESRKEGNSVNISFRFKKRFFNQLIGEAKIRATDKLHNVIVDQSKKIVNSGDINKILGIGLGLAPGGRTPITLIYNMYNPTLKYRPRKGAPKRAPAGTKEKKRENVISNVQLSVLLQQRLAKTMPRYSQPIRPTPRYVTGKLARSFQIMANYRQGLIGFFNTPPASGYVDTLNENGWMLDETLVEPTIRQITQQLFGRQFRVLRTQ